MSAYSTQEVRVHVVRECPADARELGNAPGLIADYYQRVVTKASWFDPEKECFIVIALTRRNSIRAYSLVSLGGMTAALAHPRGVFRAAIVMGAAAIVCLHNHPSGDPAPSTADVSITRQLREGAKIIDIDLLDHIIMGTPAGDPNARGFYSFREAGLL